jgi:MFS family permease
MFLSMGKLHPWMTVFASFVIHFIVIGTTAVFGVYLLSYKSIYPQSLFLLSGIGTLRAGMQSFLAIPVGRLIAKWGYGNVCRLGSLLFLCTLLAASYATEYWHSLLFHGILFGIATSLAYFPALSITQHWFSEQRGLATGIAVAGSGVGGLCLAPLTNLLIIANGWQFALRVTGIVGGVVVFICSFLLQSKLPTPPKQFNYSKVWRNLTFMPLPVAVLLFSFGYYVPQFYIASYSVEQGLTSAQGALILGLLNGASGLGRIILGAVADKFGFVETCGATLASASLACFVIWPFARSFAMIIFFAIVFGFSVGGFISVLPSTIVVLLGYTDVPTYTGFTYSAFLPGSLFGGALAGLLIDNGTTILDGKKYVNYISSMMFSGSFLFAAFLFCYFIINRRKSESFLDLK